MVCDNFASMEEALKEVTGRNEHIKEHIGAGYFLTVVYPFPYIFIRKWNYEKDLSCILFTKKYILKLWNGMN